MAECETYVRFFLGPSALTATLSGKVFKTAMKPILQAIG